MSSSKQKIQDRFLRVAEVALTVANNSNVWDWFGYDEIPEDKDGEAMFTGYAIFCLVFARIERDSKVIKCLNLKKYPEHRKIVEAVMPPFADDSTMFYIIQSEIETLVHDCNGICERYKAGSAKLPKFFKSGLGRTAELVQDFIKPAVENTVKITDDRVSKWCKRVGGRENVGDTHEQSGTSTVPAWLRDPVSVRRVKGCH